MHENKTTATWPAHEADWQDASWRRRVREKLLKWFAANARTMPWRSDPTPYHVWVSEVMLQQTQVATVLPYFKRWMESFPTIESLARADESNLMRHWEGLGYYRRVRSMHAAAKQIIERHDGVFPTTYDEVLALPGVGRYTAGAVLSISQGQRLPVLEGNTVRIYSRLIGMASPPAEKPANDLLWAVASEMLPAKSSKQHSGIYNQAAMELGALVCTPKKPDCDDCPVMRYCHAAAKGLQAEIPGKVTKIKYEDRTEFALVICRDHDGEQQYLVRPLPAGGRWAGLWDFPRPTDTATENVQRAADWLGIQIQSGVQPGIRLKSLRHAVTKFRICLHVHAAALDSAATFTPPQPWEWVSAARLAELPMSVTGRKIVSLLAELNQSFLPLD